MERINIDNIFEIPDYLIMVKTIPSEQASNTSKTPKLSKKQGHLPKPKTLDKGRPQAESVININKIKALLEKELFYHQHRISLIKANMKEYYSDSQTEIYQHIEKKIEGQIDFNPLSQLLQVNQRDKKELKSMIETALTLKNVNVRNYWQKIYFEITKQILVTKIQQVNSTSKMELWGQKFKLFLVTQLNEYLQQVKAHFPSAAKVEDLIIKQIYCMLARYFHFQVNICGDDKSEKDEKQSKQQNQNSSVY